MKKKETNLEHYLDEAVNQISSNPLCYLQKKYIKRYHRCLVQDCHKCQRFCMQWLSQEYKEPIKITKAEKVILENIPNRGNWIVRNNNNELFIFEAKPYKSGSSWNAPFGNFSLTVYSHLFQFITWEDEEPTHIPMLLANCVVSEDE